MLIWIPVDTQNREDAKISKVMDAKAWALVEFDAGEVKSTTFYDTREEFMDWVDFIIMKDKYESFMDFMNEGMMVLCTRNEESLDEVMEAFVFKELDEVGV